MEIIVKTFQQLTTEELYEILKIRCAVFIVEQNCPYQDIDDTDKTALHIFLKDEKGAIISYLRRHRPHRPCAHYAARQRPRQYRA